MLSILERLDTLGEEMEKYSFYKNDPVNSIVEIIERSSRIYKDAIAVKYKYKRKLREKSYNDLLSDSKICAKNLLLQNPTVKHIAVLGASSYEWVITYLGTVFAGLVIVPLDKELTAEELTAQIIQADVDCLVFDEEYADIALKISDCTNLKTIAMRDLLTDAHIEISLPEVDPDKLSAIVFTSGTTGKSKGVMLTQRNIANNVLQGLGAVNVKHGKDVIMSVLPLNHAYEFTCTILGMAYKGVTICISSGLKYLQREFKEYKPTVMFVVPLIAEKLYEKVEQAVKEKDKEKLFTFATKLTKLFYKHKINISNLFLKEIKTAFGGNLRILMCGGAPLKEELINKYNGIGINLFQGYGLTECSPLLTVNFDYYHRPGSVGKIVDKCDVKIVDGEIWAKGVSVATGYYNNAEETKKSFCEGWFKTGDLGYVDKDGFIFITGRKKNLIILDNGKNVSAEELEELLYNIPYITETVVYGKNNLIMAEIYIDKELHSVTEAQLQSDIKKINISLPTYKNINKIILRDEPFEKTTSKKIKRVDR